MKLDPGDQVTRITSTPALGLDTRATLREAAAMLSSGNVGAVMVVPEGEGPVALISEHDIIQALADGADPDGVSASEVITDDAPFATPAQSIRSVAEEMVESGVPHIPVIDEGHVVGVVEAREVLRVLTLDATGAEDPPSDAAPHVRRSGFPVLFV